MTTRIAIALAGKKKMNVAALQTLVLSMNLEQSDFEFEFYNCDTMSHPLLRKLCARVVERDLIKTEMAEFYESFLLYSDAIRKHNSLLAEKDGPDRLVVIAPSCRFTDNYYSTRTKSMTILALGNWKRHMAPPSLLEFIQVFLIIEAVRGAIKMLRSGHLGTRGCILDFTYYLDEARQKVLRGFVCSTCTRHLQARAMGSIARSARRLLDRSWMGLPTDPRSVAGIVSNLRYPLFVTKGARATPIEIFINSLRQESAKQILALIVALIGAVVVFLLGIKAG